MNSIVSLMDIIILAAGLYGFYVFYAMKMKRKIDSKLLLSEMVDVNKCKDKDGYIAYMLPRVIVFACAATISGASNLLNTYVVNIAVVAVALYVVFFGVLIWYAVSSKKAVKRFW